MNYLHSANEWVWSTYVTKTAEGRSSRRKTWTSITVSTTSTTPTDPESNPGLRSKRPERNYQIHGVKVKVNCTFVQAMRLCTGRTAHRGSRGIALPFHDHGTRRGVRGQRQAAAALYPRERPGNHCTGGWVGPRAGLERCGKSRPHRDSIPRPSSP